MSVFHDDDLIVAPGPVPKPVWRAMLALSLLHLLEGFAVVEGQALGFATTAVLDPELVGQFLDAREVIVGALGWALPLLTDHRGRATGAGWPRLHERPS